MDNEQLLKENAKLKELCQSNHDHACELLAMLDEVKKDRGVMDNALSYCLFFAAGIVTALLVMQ